MSDWTPKNGENVTEEYNDNCPAHGNEIRKEYDFGRRDATVITFQGCKCACVINSWNDVTYYESYNLAEGKATLEKSENRF